MATAIAMRQTAKNLLRKTGLFHPLRDLLQGISPKNRLRYQKQLEFHRALIDQGQLCFDIGANYGYKTAIFAELGARVISLEPVQECLEGLEWHHGSNRMVTIVPKAVSDSVGTAALFVGDCNLVSSLRSDWSAAGKATEVLTTTLDELISLYGCPDFCKVDVEGCEIQVFRGLSHRIPLIAFEFMQHELELSRSCLTELSKLGRLHCNASPMVDMRFLYKDWIDPEPLVERLADEREVMGDIFVRIS